MCKTFSVSGVLILYPLCWQQPSPDFFSRPRHRQLIVIGAGWERSSDTAIRTWCRLRSGEGGARDSDPPWHHPAPFPASAVNPIVAPGLMPILRRTASRAPAFPVDRSKRHRVLIG